MTVKVTDINNLQSAEMTVRVTDIKNLQSAENTMKVTVIKFHENPCSGNEAIRWRRKDERTDRRDESECKKRLNKQLSKWEHRPGWALHCVSQGECKQGGYDTCKVQPTSNTSLTETIQRMAESNRLRWQTAVCKVQHGGQRNNETSASRQVGHTASVGSRSETV
jgi:hypothetical protein